MRWALVAMIAVIAGLAVACGGDGATASPTVDAGSPDTTAVPSPAAAEPSVEPAATDTNSPEADDRAQVYFIHTDW